MVRDFIGSRPNCDNNSGMGFIFVSSRRRHTRCSRDWSSDVCSSDLSHSRSRFALLVQSVTDYAIYMLDPEGRIVSWNLGAKRIKGYEEEEVLNTHFSRFYTQIGRASCRERV